jgi:hypothetical protein
MRMRITIDAPTWDGFGSHREPQRRANVLAAALKSMADKISNCGAADCTFEGDELTANFRIEGPSASPRTKAA